MSRTTREDWKDQCIYVKAGMTGRWVKTAPYATWNDLLTGTGNEFDGYPEINYVGLQLAGSASHLPENNPWDWLRRFAVVWDPRVDYEAVDYFGMPPGAIAIAARVRVWVSSKTYWGTKPTFNVYALTPGTPGDLDHDDYVNFGSVPFCDVDIGYDDLVVGARNDFELNDDGLAYLDFGNFISLGIRIRNFDVAGIEHEIPDSVMYQGCGPVITCANYTETKALLEIDYESPPWAATYDAQNVEQYAARLRGRLNVDGGLLCQGRFEYGETLDFGEVTDWQLVAEENPVINQGFFTADVGGLKPGTTYFFRAVAANAMGTDYGHGTFAHKQFTTLPGPSLGKRIKGGNLPGKLVGSRAI